ncbi:outer membrane protein assembly factor BamB family protein [Nocardioides sp. HB32]
MVVTPTAGAHAAGGSGPPQWPMFGQNLNNTANAPATKIGTGNVGALKPKWAFTTGGDISARAAVVDGVAYFPDWSGHLYAIKSSSGKLVWSKTILADYLSDAFSPAPAKVVSRTSPALDTATNTLYVGTQKGAYLLAINATTGALKWRTQLDSHPLAIDTASPAVFNGVVYVGVASLEEGAAVDSTYPCCSFRGSVMAVNATTGAVLWKTYTVPTGYNGGAVWGSTIVPDPARGFVYATTGNNYFTPTDPDYTACIDAGRTQEQCNSPDDHVDSVMALRIADGTIAWSDRFATSDDWTVACFFGGTNCPVNSGPDFDFGSGVQLFTAQTATGPKTLIGAGQKSGVYTAIDPSTGTVVWATQVGPGSSLGGMEWGSATDGKRIYVQIANFYGIPDQVGNGTTTQGGEWAALDAATGRIIWKVADPNGAVDLGPMTVANGVVYAASMAGGATNKTMFGLDAATGKTLWSYAAGSSVNAGASIANDTVFWGSGYSNLGIPGFTGNNKLYAFSIGGQ